MADFLPRPDGLLLQWMNGFGNALNAGAEDYGITPQQLADFNDVWQAFKQAYRIATSTTTRTKPNIVAKNDARSAAKKSVRLLSRLIQSNPNVTDVQKQQLGLAVRDEYPRQHGLPGKPPRLIVKSTRTELTRLTLRDAEHLGKARPRGVVGAAIFYHIGKNPPAKPSDWKLARNTTVTDCAVAMPAGLPIGTPVWFSAAWLDRQLNIGPWCQPELAHIEFRTAGGKSHVPRLAA